MLPRDTAQLAVGHWSGSDAFRQPVVRMCQISKRFAGVVALDKVDFDLLPGEVHCLIGENGAGKSTLVKILAGALRPDSGRIEIQGRPVTLYNPHEGQRLGLAFIFQELSVVNGLCVAENIMLGDEPRRGPLFDSRTANQRARELLLSIGFGSVDPLRLVGELSIAEKQGVMIARALHLQARVVVMDEPTSSLDADEVEHLFLVVDRLRAEGKSVIFISHRLHEVSRIADRVTVFKDGKKIVTCPASQLSSHEMVRLMVGRTVEYEFPPKTRLPGPVVLRARNLVTAMLRGVSLELRRGEILGIAGLVGSGRTEVLRALFGADRLHAGSVELNDRDLLLRSPRDAIRASIGLVPEDRRTQGIVPIQSVQENLLMVWSQFTQARKPGHDRRSIVSFLVEKLRVKTPSLEQRIALLSGGNQQKVVVGKWLTVGTQVLLLDEPTKGIDVGAKLEMFDLIDRLARDGMAVILVSSELPEILGMADRILVMREGRVIGELGGQVSEADIVALAMTHEEET